MYELWIVSFWRLNWGFPFLVLGWLREIWVDGMTLCLEGIHLVRTRSREDMVESKPWSLRVFVLINRWSAFLEGRYDQVVTFV